MPVTTRTRGSTEQSAHRGERSAQLVQLLRPTARAMRWSPLGVSAIASMSIVFAMTRDTCLAGQTCISDGMRIAALRLGMLVVAMGAAFALDDPTGESTAHLPTPRWLRRAVRLTLLAAALAPGWAVLVGLALRDKVVTDPFPTGGMTLEFVATLGVAFAVSALGARYAPDRLGGIVAGPVLFGSAIIALVLPGRWNLLVTEPQGPLWNHAHALWRGVLAWGVIVLAVASRDVWRRNPFRARRRSSRDLAQRRTQAARPRLTNPATWKGPDATDRAVSEGEDIEASPLGPLRQ